MPAPAKAGAGIHAAKKTSGMDFKREMNGALRRHPKKKVEPQMHAKHADTF
jgi:hypothetical protein